MTPRQILTIDRAGRIVVPKALRDQLGVMPGDPLRASVRDGRLEIEPEPLRAELIERDGVLVITPLDSIPPMSRDDVRAALESVRR